MRASPSAPRWLLVLALIAVAALAVSSVARAAASPAQDIQCSWVRLDTGEDRSQSAMAFMPDSDAIFQYGGVDNRPDSQNVKDDLYKLPLANNSTKKWERVTTTGSPGDRMEHSAVLRQVPGGGQEMIVFGGNDTANTGTWTSPLVAGGRPYEGALGAHGPTSVQSTAYRLGFASGDANGWTRINVTAEPRTDHSAIWSPPDDAMIVYGGRRTEEATSAQDNVMALTLGESPAWTTYDIPDGPGKRFAHTAIYDTTATRMIVYGGTRDWTSAFDDVWALSLLRGIGRATWQKVDTTGTAPAGRFDHAAAFLPNLEWMVIYGGTSNGTDARNDTWALDLSTDPAKWIRLNPAGNGPPSLVELAGTYSSIGDMAVFQGGQTTNDSLGQTWGLTCVPAGVATPTESAETPTATESAETPTPTESVETPTPTESVETPTQETPEATHTPTVGLTPTLDWHVFLPYTVDKR